MVSLALCNIVRFSGQRQRRDGAHFASKRDALLQQFYPIAIDVELEWPELDFVGHLLALLDPVAEVQVIEAQLPGAFDLPEDGEGSDAAILPGLSEPAFS